MNWQDDPEITAQRAERRARMALWRTTIIWTPIVLVLLGAFLFFFFDRLAGSNNGSTWFLVVLLGIFTALLSFQSLQSLTDLFREPLEMTGYVTRRWSRIDSLVMRSHYIRIEKHIFRINKNHHGDPNEGDYVWVRYYPSSSTVVTVERREAPGDEPEEEGQTN